MCKLVQFAQNGLGAPAREPAKGKAPLAGGFALLREGEVSDFLFLGADDLAVFLHLAENRRDFVRGRRVAVLIGAGEDFLVCGDLCHAHGVVEDIADDEHQPLGVFLFFGLLGRGFLPREQVEFVRDEVIVGGDAVRVQIFEQVGVLFVLGDFLFGSHFGFPFLRWSQPLFFTFILYHTWRYLSIGF